MYHAQVSLFGNIVEKPMLQFFDEAREKPFCRFSVGLNRKFRNSQQQTVEESHFFECFASGKVAESIERFGDRGDRILIDGEIRQEKWQDKTSGENRSKVVVHVRGFPTIISRKPREQTADSPTSNDSDEGERPF